MSGSPFADKTCDIREIVHGTANSTSVLDGGREQRLHLRPCGFRAQKRRPGQFFLRDVLAGGLAERGRRLLDVEKVVDDLEGEADRLAVAAEGGERVVVRAGQQPAEEDGGGEELGG